MRLSLLAPPATVTASDLDTRTLAGIALPYGVQGSTSAGLVQVDAGAVRIPVDLRRVKLFTEHGRTTPVGYTLTADDGPDQLLMSFRVAATPAGDDALLEASEGVRDGLSVELDNVVIRAGHVTAADLVAVATTAIPAYADARLVASDTPPDEQTPPDPAPPADPPGDDDDEEDEEETMSTTAPAPETRASLPTAGALTAARPEPPGGLVRQLAAAFSAVDQGRASREQLFAALADIRWSDAGGVTGAPPQVLGELWQGVSYARKWVPQTSYSTDLSSMTVGGFVWNPKPEVGPYAGNKAAIPTGPAAMVWTEFPASRFAGGHDIDRIYRDFNTPGFWEAYWSAMTESYAMQSDGYVIDTLVAGGTAGTATSVWDAIIKGTLAVAPYSGSSQLKIAIAANQIAGLATLTNDAQPALFSSLFSSLEDLLNATGPGVPDNTVVVWAQPAVTVKEAGAVPIRAEALNIPNGGIDAGLFGYICAFVTRAEAVQVYTLPAPVVAGDDTAPSSDVTAPSSSSRRKS